MTVKLFNYSQMDEDFFEEIEEFEKPKGLLDLIAYCARVSNPQNQNSFDTSHKLIKYLIKNKHWSPFEMVSACLQVETTRDIARQILRHRSFSFQEFSQRYANVDAFGEDAFVIKEARLQDIKNRQNSIELVESRGLALEWALRQKEVIDLVQKHYTWAISQGIAKEVARVILPEGNTKSKMYINGTIRSWIHYISLRSENGTQKEHREIAIACANAIAKIFSKDILLQVESNNDKEKIENGKS